VAWRAHGGKTSSLRPFLFEFFWWRAAVTPVWQCLPDDAPPRRAFRPLYLLLASETGGTAGVRVPDPIPIRLRRETLRVGVDAARQRPSAPHGCMASSRNGGTDGIPYLAQASYYYTSGHNNAENTGVLGYNWFPINREVKMQKVQYKSPTNLI
jgi:hypothetical protein